MPIYEYLCDCGKEKEVFKQIKDIDIPVECDCGKIMQRRICAPGYSDFKPYFDWNLTTLDNNDGHWVKSRKHKKELMKKCKVEYIGRKQGKPGCWV